MSGQRLDSERFFQRYQPPQLPVLQEPELQPPPPPLTGFSEVIEKPERYPASRKSTLMVPQVLIRPCSTKTEHHLLQKSHHFLWLIQSQSQRGACSAALHQRDADRGFNIIVGEICFKILDRWTRYFQHNNLQVVKNWIWHPSRTSNQTLTFLFLFLSMLLNFLRSKQPNRGAGRIEKNRKNKNIHITFYRTAVYLISQRLKKHLMGLNIIWWPILQKKSA